MSIRRCPNGRCWLDFRRPFGVLNKVYSLF
nr:MAG TPA: Neurohypophysial hormone [Caudoviricetes sp.]DAY27534.1 MAG TPA: Neurohypophysial hormone [Caudoviricetes sp.]